MSDNYSHNESLKLYENERNVKLIKDHKCTTVSVPSSKILQLVSIFENEESETKLKSLSQRRLTTATTTATAVARGEETEKAKRADEADGTDDEAGEAEASPAGRPGHAPAEGAAVQGDGNFSSNASYTSTVSVTNRGGNWTGQRDRNLLFVIHPWCMLHKSSADRQSEFPPPGFLERLKAKLMALHRQSDEQQRQRHGPAAAAVVCRRRRHTHQRIKCWFQYTATALGGGGTTTATSAVHHAARPRNEPAAVVDFLSVWRRCANAAAACGAADRG
ncbi:uncharacterized protein LOC113555655 [Rhopalosiphum maidis]|uniref:uncharacterized protein LOC113555655 n=1 Tax=Rhopalosiphum maidis TaxID=43146 RepID=UPI000F00EC78|nr:uncharacterized protein LOC113555655 [Rhopalosiphum maidis]